MRLHEPAPSRAMGQEKDEEGTGCAHRQAVQRAETQRTASNVLNAKEQVLVKSQGQHSHKEGIPGDCCWAGVDREGPPGSLRPELSVPCLSGVGVTQMYTLALLRLSEGAGCWGPCCEPSTLEG